MLLPSEMFLIYLLLGLIGFLGFVSLFSFTFIFRKKRIERDLPVHKVKTRNKKRKMQIRHRESNISGNFTEKLGQKIVRYMIEIAQSGEKNYVRERTLRIIRECERLNDLDLPAENKKIISTVLLWANGFEPDRHISEMKIFQRSSQIIYDRKKRDFKLRLFGK